MHNVEKYLMDRFPCYKEEKKSERENIYIFDFLKVEKISELPWLVLFNFRAIFVGWTLAKLIEWDQGKEYKRKA